jgi:hypothetical protein
MAHLRPRRTPFALLLFAALPSLAAPAACAAIGRDAADEPALHDPIRWGRDGHVMSGLAAATGLPAEMPQFFRDAREQLGYLSYEPDRWRDGRFPELNEAFQYDHFIDLENVTADALTARDRFHYILTLSRAGLADPQSAGGMLPFRILEIYERLLLELRLWRAENNPANRRFIEARIINDAGILGHYVEDGANPHHATIHYNGWAEGALNPNGYTMDRTFHRRFESDFVGARVRLEDLLPRVRAPRVVPDVRAAVFAHIRDSNAQVGRLYELEKERPFGAENGLPAHKEFAVERLSVGIDLLRSLWWTAWVQSEQP